MVSRDATGINAVHLATAEPERVPDAMKAPARGAFIELLGWC